MGLIIFQQLFHNTKILKTNQKLKIMRYEEIISVIAIAAIVLNVILIVKFLYLCKDVLAMRKDIRRIADKYDPEGAMRRKQEELAIKENPFLHR